MKNLALIFTFLTLLLTGCANTAPNQTQTKNANAQVNQVLEGENIYNITSASVSYDSQKEWLKKPTEKVTGTSTDVTGQIKLNEESGSFSLNAEIHPTFESGSTSRDNIVTNLLAPTIQVTANNAPISKQINLNLSIAGQTISVPFNVEYNIEDGNLNASGSASFDMTEIGVEPPSALNLYTVNEVVDVSFDVTAEK